MLSLRKNLDGLVKAETDVLKKLAQDVPDKTVTVKELGIVKPGECSVLSDGVSLVSTEK